MPVGVSRSPRRALFAMTALGLLLLGCGDDANDRSAEPAPSQRQPVPVTAQLLRNGGSSCPIGGQDKGLTVVTSGWLAGDPESELTTLCAGTFQTAPADGYIDIERLTRRAMPARCSNSGFRVPGSGALTITDAPEGRGRMAVSSRRHGLFHHLRGERSHASGLLN